jgi:tetratricopeptide (TPR) repeat protein
LVQNEKIHLRIVHGHLAFARFPVLVGHYNGDTFAGAEAQLDKALDLRLSERRRLGLYPGPIATSTVVLDPAARPRGAVVVGLGESADLSVGTLRRTLRHGMLAFGASEMERQRAIPSSGDELNARGITSLGLSTMLVGAGEGGLDRTSCVEALLRAAVETQAILADVTGSEARISQIEIIELLEYRALAIYRAVAQALVAQLDLSRAIELVDGVVRRNGARRRMGAARDRSWWQPIQITMSGEGQQRSLLFAVAGGLARAEARAIAADLDLVEPLIQRAIENIDATGGAAPGRALFELLWPRPLKDQSTDERNRRLILDEQSASFPWELLDDRRSWCADPGLPGHGDHFPPAVRAGLVRQLIQTRFQEQLVVPRGRPKALVVGDPRGLPMDGFVELPAAQKEARFVAEQLANTHDVTSLIGDSVTPDQVCSQLFTESWEIIHIAAHGVVGHLFAGPDGAKRSMTGVVLGGGVVLGPSAFSKLPVSPSLFFINCCHLGHIDSAAEDRERRAALAGGPEFAASVAVELIKNGARCVIAAGWVVDDIAAEAFGKRLYKEMLYGATFGEATLMARQDAFGARPQSNTWGAYQCYGEPDYRLRGFGRSTNEGEVPNLVSIAEAIEAVDQIREDVNIGLERNLDTQRKRLTTIEEQSRKRNWLGSDELLVALAEARSELGELATAIEHYQAALASASGQVKIKAIEQFANLRARHAVTVFRRAASAERDIGKTIQEIEAARHLVESLSETIGATPERLALQGSCWKRLAQVQATSADVDEVLDRMATCYRRALEISPTNNDYPSLMFCSARVSSAIRKGEAVDDTTIRSLKKLSDAEIVDDSDFWQLIMSADARMMVAMTQDNILDRDQLDIEKAYRRAWRHVGSPVKLMSVLEQLEYYEDIFACGVPASETKRKSIVARAARLRDILESEYLEAG